MLLFVSLGNPGAKYAHNRHNIGFMAVEAISRRHGFAPWRRRFQGETSEGALGGERAGLLEDATFIHACGRAGGGGGRVVLLKPATFMNESGRAVGEAANFFKIGVGDITVFHDELELPPVKVR